MCVRRTERNPLCTQQVYIPADIPKSHFFLKCQYQSGWDQQCISCWLSKENFVINSSTIRLSKMFSFYFLGWFLATCITVISLIQYNLLSDCHWVVYSFTPVIMDGKNIVIRAISLVLWKKDKAAEGINDIEVPETVNEHVAKTGLDISRMVTPASKKNQGQGDLLL